MTGKTWNGKGSNKIQGLEENTKGCEKYKGWNKIQGVEENKGMERKYKGSGTKIKGWKENKGMEKCEGTYTGRSLYVNHMEDIFYTIHTIGELNKF